VDSAKAIDQPLNQVVQVLNKSEFMLSANLLSLLRIEFSVFEMTIILIGS